LVRHELFTQIKPNEDVEQFILPTHGLSNTIDLCLPRRRHISKKGKDFVICENANLKFAKLLKKHFNKRSQPTCINVVSLDTSGHIVLRSDISSLRLGKLSKRQVNLALNLPSLIMLFGNNGIIFKGILPHVIRVVSMATSKPNASK